MGGLGRQRSPNLGLVVKVAFLQGEHSQFGRIWCCTNPDIKQLTDAGGNQVTGIADFPGEWLQKLPPAANDSGANRVAKLQAA